MTHALQLVLIHNSHESDGTDNALVQWITAVVQERSEFELNAIEPFDLRFTDGLSQQRDRRACLNRLAAADAYIVLTPARRLGYAHGLKPLMARWPEHFQTRPVACVSYGCTTGAEAEVEQLRWELLDLHAMPLGSCSAFTEIAARFNQSAGFERYAQARVPMAQLLVQLAWWARALKDARAFAPYQKVG